jgi:ATP-dependent RNA helicase DeaD
LALQVQRELAWLYKYANARVIACVGGMDPRREAALLDEGAHIVVGTPGRLRDHIERHRSTFRRSRPSCSTRLTRCSISAFRDDLEFILKTTPAERQQPALFGDAAQGDHPARDQELPANALRIEVTGGSRGMPTSNIAPSGSTRRKPSSLSSTCCASMIRRARWYSATPATPCAISRRSCWSAASRPWRSRANSAQSERNSALQALRDGRARVCVATDVAARGIDLPGLTLVIHAELPNDPEVMQHRSGRTGRAGNKGTSVLLVPKISWISPCRPARARPATMPMARATPASRGPRDDFGASVCGSPCRSAASRMQSRAG